MSVDPHEHALRSLADVARAAVGALNTAIASLDAAPEPATRAIAEQATLLSKSVGSLAKRMEVEPTRRSAETQAMAVQIEDVVDALDRLRDATAIGFCSRCDGVLPSE